MTRFNWQLASLEEMAVEVYNGTQSRVNQQLFHYRKKNNVVMLDRLSKAIKLSKAWELEDAAKVLKLELGLIND